MRRAFLLIALLLVSIPPTMTTFAQKGTGTIEDGGVRVECPGDLQITNGVEIIVNMRPGFTYTATALGLDGFDPVIAVLDRGVVTDCSDDVDDVSNFVAELPTTGQVSGTSFGAQLPFSHDYDTLEDISIVVGGAGGAGGEFLLILEGMAITELDGTGDPFYLRLTPNLVNAPIDPAVYMLAANQQLDTLVQWVSNNDEGEVISACDDAGTEFCDDATLPSLNTSYVSRTAGRRTPPSARNAMLVLPTTEATDVSDEADNFYSLLMTSFDQNTTGDYAVAFHVGIEGEAQIVSEENKEDPKPTATPGSAPSDSAMADNGGITVTCPDGREIINGVEIIVNMRPSFTYTATAIGIDGFDPIMAVSDENSVIACSDDTTNAANITAALPTTDRITANRLSAQLPFSHNFNGPADISIVVGGFEGSGGQFVLLLEGMVISAEDGEGDPFTVNFTPNMLEADVDLSVFMLSTDNTLDALLQLVDEDQILLECDDAGTEFCDTGSSDLTSYAVTRSFGTMVNGKSSDAMLTVPTSQLANLDFDNAVLLRFLMTSFGGSQGEYVVLFHIGIGG